MRAHCVAQPALEKMTEPDFNDNETKKNGVPRAYEQSGLYPVRGKPFRLWALLGWLTLLIVALAGVSAMLNFILI
jgi:hypothetical protein